MKNIVLGPEVEPLIYSKFDGLDENYQKAIDAFKVRKNSGKFNQQYIDELRTELKQAIVNDFNSRVEQAKSEIEALKGQYREKLKPKKEIVTPANKEEELLHEIKRMNEMTLLNAKVKGSNLAELKDLYDQYSDNEDFKTLFTYELKNRENSGSVNMSDMAALKAHLEYDPVNEAFKELEKQLNAVKSTVNGGMYPEGLSKTGIREMKLRQINKDIDN